MLCYRTEPLRDEMRDTFSLPWLWLLGITTAGGKNLTIMK